MGIIGLRCGFQGSVLDVRGMLPHVSAAGRGWGDGVLQRSARRGGEDCERVGVEAGRGRRDFSSAGLGWGKMRRGDECGVEGKWCLGMASRERKGRSGFDNGSVQARSRALYCYILQCGDYDSAAANVKKIPSHLRSVRAFLAAEFAKRLESGKVGLAFTLEHALGGGPNEEDKSSFNLLRFRAHADCPLPPRADDNARAVDTLECSLGAAFLEVGFHDAEFLDGRVV